MAGLVGVAALSAGPALMIGAFRASAMGQARWRRVTAEKFTLAGLRVGLLSWAYAERHLPVASAVTVLAFATVVAGVAYVGMPLGGSGPPASDHPGLVRVVQFGMRSWVGAVSGVLLSRLDQVLMTPLSDARELGLYAVAVNIGDVPLVFVAAAGAVLLAFDGRDRDDRRVAAAARCVLLVAGSCAVVLAGLLPVLLPFVFGPDFADAYWPAVILLATAALGAPDRSPERRSRHAGVPGCAARRWRVPASRTWCSSCCSCRPGGRLRHSRCSSAVRSPPGSTSSSSGCSTACPRWTC